IRAGWRRTLRPLARTAITVLNRGHNNDAHLPLQAFLSPDGLHLNDLSYACFGKWVGAAIPAGDETSSGFGRQDHAVVLCPIGPDFLGRPNVSAAVGRNNVLDRILGDRQPNAVHFYFIVVADRAGHRRPAVRQIAARRLGVLADQLRIEAVVPSVVPDS